MPHTANSVDTNFFRDVLLRLTHDDIPFVVAGTYAFACHTGIHRPTKDLDILCKPEDIGRALECLASGPYCCDNAYPHWLAKVCHGDQFVDIVHNSGNGLSPVDDFVFQRAGRALLFGMDVPICPVEEMIWVKAFIMERERFDGADIAHLLRARARTLDWPWLLERFASHVRLLLCHLILYGYIYPQDREAVPRWVLDQLVERLSLGSLAPASDERVCLGTLVSREQYLVDICRWGYRDGRLATGAMNAEEIDAWTRAIGEG
jgi:hypothetical protein